MTCEVIGCDREALWNFAGIFVCSRCREELEAR